MTPNQLMNLSKGFVVQQNCPTKVVQVVQETVAPSVVEVCKPLDSVTLNLGCLLGDTSSSRQFNFTNNEAITLAATFSALAAFPGDSLAFPGLAASGIDYPGFVGDNVNGSSAPTGPNGGLSLFGFNAMLGRVGAILTTGIRITAASLAQAKQNFVINTQSWSNDTGCNTTLRVPTCSSCPNSNVDDFTREFTFPNGIPLGDVYTGQYNVLAGETVGVEIFIGAVPAPAFTAVGALTANGSCGI